MNYLTTSSIWISVVLLVCIPTLLSMSCPFLVRRALALEELRPNNEVAGFKFAVIGVLYAVLLAFAVVVVWERYTDAEVQVAHEAGAATTIYRLSYGVGGPAGEPLRQKVSAYLTSAIERDWPAMAQGKGGSETTSALSALYEQVLRFEPATSRESEIMYELLYQLDQIAEARRDRLVAAAGHIPGLLWTVLLGGGLLTVGYTLFFGTLNLRAQSLMTGLLTLLISSVLLVVIGIDRPFSGTVHVSPEAFIAVMEDLGK